MMLRSGMFHVKWSFLEKHFLEVVNHFGVYVATALSIMGHMDSDELGLNKLKFQDFQVHHIKYHLK